MSIAIKRRFDSNKVLYISETAEDLRAAVLEAIQKRIDLREADLRSLNLGNADLRGVDLRDVDLRGAYLGGTDLRGADLCDADLRGADALDVDFRGAILHDAKGISGLRGRGLADVATATGPRERFSGGHEFRSPV